MVASGAGNLEPELVHGQNIFLGLCVYLGTLDPATFQIQSVDGDRVEEVSPRRNCKFDARGRVGIYLQGVHRASILSAVTMFGPDRA